MRPISLALAAALLLSACALSAQIVVLKPVSDSLRLLSPESQIVKRSCFDDLAKSKRLRFLAQPKPDDPAATHLLDFAPTCTVDKKFGVPSYVDSTKTINILASYSASTVATLTCYDIETGSVRGVQNIRKAKTWQRSYALTYGEAGYVKGKTKADRDFLRKLEDLVKKNNDLEFNYKLTFDQAVSETRSAVREALNGFFPFRLELLEVTEAKGDKAKNVLISGGSNYDLSKRERLAVYKVATVEANGKQYERLIPVGRLKFEEDDPKGGKAEVLRGEKALLQEFNAKTKLYCNPGFTALPLRDNRQTLKVAIGSFQVEGYTPAQRDALFKRVEIELYGTKNFSLVDRQRRGLLEAEKQFQKSDDMVGKSTVDQYKSMGADLLVALKVGTPEFTHVENYNSETGATTRVPIVQAPVQLRLLAVETGEILGNENATAQIAFPTGTTVTAARAYDVAANGMYLGVSGMLQRVFPPVVSVVEILDEDRKGGADEVLLSGDVEYAPFNKYKVMRERTIQVDGRDLIRLEEVGEVSIREMEGEGLFSAKVKEGSKAIAEAFKAGHRLICTDKPGMFEKMSSSALKLGSKLNPALKD